MSSQNIVFTRRVSFRTWLLVLLCVPLLARAQNTAPQVPAPANNPKKLWSNENIRSLRGHVPLAGSSSLQASASEHRFDSTSNGGTFVNPKPGQVVNPGETLHVDVAIDSGITLLSGAGIRVLLVRFPKYGKRRRTRSHLRFLTKKVVAAARSSGCAPCTLWGPSQVARAS